MVISKNYVRAMDVLALVHLTTCSQLLWLLVMVVVVAQVDTGDTSTFSVSVRSSQVVTRDTSAFSVSVRSPPHAITGQTVQLYCDLSLPPAPHQIYSLQWFLEDREIYRFVPGAARRRQRMLFHTEEVTVDLESSKLLSPLLHQLVLLRVKRSQSGDYRCQVTLDSPPFPFLSAQAPLTVMVLPERLPRIQGTASRPHSATLGYLPGDKLSINCTSAPSHPAASLAWLVNRRPVDRWMVTSYLPTTSPAGLHSSVLGLSFLVLAEHFRGPERELWATCQASMPPIQGAGMMVQRTLLLGSLATREEGVVGHGAWGMWPGGGGRRPRAGTGLLLVVILICDNML